MTTPEIHRPRNPLLWTVLVLFGAGALVLLASALWTEKLWFDSVGFTVVFGVELGTRVVLFLIGFALMAGSVFLNMWGAHRTSPTQRRRGSSAVLDRYRDLLEHNLKVALFGPALLLGVMAGLSASTQSLPVLAWLNRTPAGKVDPRFGLDLSFYMLEYPVWRLGMSLLMSALVFGAIAAVIVHFAVGNLVAGPPRLSREPSPATRHLSILGALIVAGYGVENLLDRYGMYVTDGTLFTGLHYTDDHARLTAKLVVAVIAFLVALLFAANVWYNKTFVPMVGVVLMLVSGLILAFIYPAIVQSFNVKPNEPDKEAPYIDEHVKMTREAFNISGVETTEYEAVTKVEPGQLKQDAAALPGIRLMDPDVIGPTFEQLQQVRGYYTFSKTLDIDRYDIDGQETDVVVAARELKPEGIPDPNWNNVHTVFTHGHGMVAAYGNRRQTMGDPSWITRDIPPKGTIEQTQSRIYYGEQSHTFAIVGRPEGQPPIELDSPGGGEGGAESFNTYDGTGGVPIGTWLRRIMFSARFSDLNLLLSDRVNSESKVLFDRTPKQRVQKVAPWLTVDDNVYPAIVGGRVVWIVDAYTTSNYYPNSERVSLGTALSDAQTPETALTFNASVNYMRNSVKAVVDAYDGTVKLYAWDDKDPLLASYTKAFPNTVLPKADIPKELLDHLRYPEDLFKVQRDLLARYHMTNPRQWYGGTDLWAVPVDPVKKSAKEPPYYLSIKWPGDKAPVFSQTAVFVPSGRANLASYLAVNADAASPDYGKMRILRMSGTHQIDGPGQTQNAIDKDPAIAQQLLPYTQNKGQASVAYGNLLTLPMGNGLLYVEPIYTERSGAAGSYPALSFVVVRFGEHVGIGTTLQEALDAVFAGDAGASTGEEPGGQPTASPSGGPSATPTPGPVDQAKAVAAMQRADQAMADAQKALRAGDLATYQKKNDEAKAAVAEALKAMGR